MRAEGSSGKRRVYAIGIVFVLLNCVGRSFCQVADNGTSTDEFLERCKRECAIENNVMTCGRYRAIKWINNIVEEKEYVYGPFKIIKIPAIESERFLPELPRTKKSSIGDTLHFVREATEELITRRAFVYTIDQPSGARSLTNGIMVLDDDELGNVRKARTFEAHQPYYHHHYPWGSSDYSSDYPAYGHDDWYNRNDVGTGGGGGGYGNYYGSHSFHNPFAYYFQNYYNKQQQQQPQQR